MLFVKSAQFILCIHPRGERRWIYLKKEELKNEKI